MERKCLVLMPECYRLWAVSPNLILTHNIVMDKRDFGNAQAMRDRPSKYYLLVAEALRIYLEEGFITLKNYADLLKPDDRVLIHNYAKKLVSKMEENVLLDYGRWAYREYAAYQTEVLDFSRATDGMYADQVLSRNETVAHLHELEKATSIPDHFNFLDVMTRIFAKALAGMQIAMKFDLPFHDTEEYRPAIALILKDWLGQKQPSTRSMVKPALNCFCEQVLIEVFKKVIHPNLYIKELKHLPLIIQRRSDFDTLSKLLVEIEEIYQEARGVTEDTELINKIVSDVAQIDVEIENELKKIHSKISYKVPWSAFEILTSVKIPYAQLLERRLQKTSNDLSISKIERKYPQYSWFFNFKKIGKTSLKVTDFPEAKVSDSAHKIETWLRGKVPWYEKE